MLLAYFLQNYFENHFPKKACIKIHHMHFCMLMCFLEFICGTKSIYLESPT
jgi:hypothetical protein